MMGNVAGRNDGVEVLVLGSAGTNHWREQHADEGETTVRIRSSRTLSTNLFTWNENRTEKQILTSRDLMMI